MVGRTKDEHQALTHGWVVMIESQALPTVVQLQGSYSYEFSSGLQTFSKCYGISS